MPEALDDPRRVDPPLVAGEREMLEAWLDFHRVTLLLKRSEDSEHDFVPLDDVVWEDDRRAWESECESSREATCGLELDHVVRSRGGEDLSLRWIYVHMIEEYARHNGHADLIREMIDGTVGD